MSVLDDGYVLVEQKLAEPVEVSHVKVAQKLNAIVDVLGKRQRDADTEFVHQLL